MSKRVFFVLTFFSFLSSYGQFEKERMKWYFGEKAGVDFSSKPPTVLHDGVMSQAEGCAVANDNAGNLLFYSDGITVWNNKHKKMPNGEGLMGHWSTTQSVLIVRKPWSNTLYYVFTQDYTSGQNGLRYSVVDLCLDSGRGDVTVKNQLILSPSAEKLSACLHKNKKDVWIICRERGSMRFRSYLLSDKGLDTATYIRNNFNTPNNTGVNGTDECVLKVSFDHKKMVVVRNADFGADLFDFNDGTGVMSNRMSLPADNYAYYGAQFSPNSRYLYICESIGKKVHQFDLMAGDSGQIRLSRKTMNLTGFFLGDMQVAPDGKIYIARDGSNYLSAIPKPDQPYPACGIEEQALMLGSATGKSGLPNFPVVNGGMGNGKPDCACGFKAPNVFTPNGDSYNDTFKPDICEFAVDYKMAVYNRWGEIVFETTSMEDAWDGTFHGENIAEGAYFWVITYSMFNETHKTTGSLTLLR